MFHPVGSRSSSVYWRRRVLFAAVVALVVITAWVLLSGGGGGQPAAHDSTPPPSTTGHPVSTSPGSSTPRSTTSASSGSSGSSSPSGPLATCQVSALKISAVTASDTYSVGSQPVLMLQVVNPGPQPCVQDLADAQVELLVYNGESRVWGSHDCQIQPGTDLRTLAVGQPVRVSITWTGLSSQPQCAGTRQRVGAGTYTLYAKLGGQVGTTAQFSIK